MHKYRKTDRFVQNYSIKIILKVIKDDRMHPQAVAKI